MEHTGFLFKDQFNGAERKIFYIDKQGKDISFERWRAILYYHPNLAATAFFPSEKEYEKFCDEKSVFCFSDYNDYRAACGDYTPWNEKRPMKGES